MFRFRKRDVERPESSGDRLDSWKEIAVYLKRDVSTLHRWEREEALPVHRHHHKHASSVYAFKSELDRWWDNHPDRSDEVHQEAGPFLGYPFNRIALSIVTLLFLLSAVVAWVQEWGPFRPSGGFNFGERDWVLVTAFENVTGQPGLDGTLEYALERELSNSRYVNVVPRARIEDTLRLMTKPLNTRVDRNIGREICLRDGGIGAVLAGRVERLDSRYSLSLQVVDPAEGVGIAAVNEIAESDSELFSSVRRLASWTREFLGEAPNEIRSSEAKLEKVTTPSLRALQLFSEADRLSRLPTSGLSRSRNRETSIELLRAALRDDPQFAMAYTSLAWALKGEGAPREDYVQAAEAAVDLSGKVTEREHFIILASYYELTDQQEKAIPVWEALLELCPDDCWGTYHLAGLYWLMGRSEESANLRLQRAKLRPTDFDAQVEAARDSIRFLGNHDFAKRHVERARELISPELIEQRAGYVAWLESFPALAAWHEGNVSEVLDRATLISEKCPFTGDGLHPAFFRSLGGIYFALGRKGRARELFQLGKHEQGAWVLMAYDTRADLGAEKPDREIGQRDNFCAPFVLARSGRLLRAEEAVNRLAERSPNWVAALEIVQGEVARVQGETAQAISAFEKGLDNFTMWGLPGLFFLGSESLAYLLEKESDLRGALKVLKRVSERKEKVANMVEAAYWMRNEWLLAQVYRKLEREKEAHSIEAELLKLLVFADDDHPILLELKAREGAPTTASARKSP